jgi:N-glycosylase/DNA lyase
VKKEFSYEILDGQKSVLRVGNLGDYSLKDTLECGQCFRFDEVSDSAFLSEYTGVIGSRFLRIAQRVRGELLFFDTTEKEYNSFYKSYFSLDLDWSKIKNSVISAMPENEIIRSAAEVGGGIAILRQDMWEALFSFIVSQNNNIPRIKKIIRTVCALYGEKKGDACISCDACGACYSFPTPEDILKAPEKLLSAKVGFRYRYLLDAAEKVASGKVDLEALKHPRDFESAKKELLSICGVGEKVASCILLFAGNHLNAFPVDVWMKRAIDEYFEGKLEYEKFGEYAGVAQQYIFHYIRNIQN